MELNKKMSRLIALLSFFSPLDIFIWLQFQKIKPYLDNEMIKKVSWLLSFSVLIETQCEIFHLKGLSGGGEIEGEMEEAT